MSMLTSPLQAKLAKINARISTAAQAVSRDPNTVRLVAVSKTFDAQAVLEAIEAGQYRFGENYVQEAVDKIDRVRAVLSPGQNQRIEWHFIGPIQSNKTRTIAQYFDWVQSVDRLKIAERLSAQRLLNQPPLNVLIQVNISDEAGKQGVHPERAAELLKNVASLPHLRVRGLMAIPKPSDDPVIQRRAFDQMVALFATLRPLAGSQWDTLSVGMSNDLESAIAAGATMVRVGSAIFGDRI